MDTFPNLGKKKKPRSARERGILHSLQKGGIVLLAGTLVTTGEVAETKQ